MSLLIMKITARNEELFIYDFPGWYQLAYINGSFERKARISNYFYYKTLDDSIKINPGGLSSGDSRMLIKHKPN